MPLQTDLPRLPPQTFSACHKKDVLECEELADSASLLGDQISITLPGNRRFIKKGDRTRAKIEINGINSEVYEDGSGGQAIITHSPRAGCTEGRVLQGS